MNQMRKRRGLAVLLSMALLVTPLFAGTTVEAEGLLKPRGTTSESEGTTGGSKQPAATTSGGKITVKTLKSVAKSYNVSEEFLDELSNKQSITLAQLKQYAEEYTLPAQYVQRFVTNAFVFKSGSSLEYIPVNSKLAKNSYKFNNLVQQDGEYKYVVDGKTKSIKGIDVSEFQGVIDWKKVKADGVKFAFIRVGYRGYGTGKLSTDKYYAQNLKNATAAGIPVGVYVYSQAINKAEAIEEAKLALKCIKGYKITYPVVYDIEAAPSSTARTSNLTQKQHTDNTIAFCDTIKAAGYKPMIYTSSKWFLENLDMSRLEKYDKWLAQYYTMPFFPYKLNIWQYTGKGSVNGIKGDVDMNIAFVSYK